MHTYIRGAAVYGVSSSAACLGVPVFLPKPETEGRTLPGKRMQVHPTLDASYELWPAIKQPHAKTALHPPSISIRAPKRAYLAGRHMYRGQVFT